ncbi:hypothetical protein [Kitasatospora sp. NPDC057015]|uniref:hypothetical protein n=1 Tax=Kitasatospora sp. NPDC057015 TaxID=3346001 RepID=UPI003640D2FE
MRMRILDDTELLHREATWLREIASHTRWCVDELGDLDEDTRRRIRSAMLSAWIRYRCPISVQLVTNYVALVTTAVGMTAACAAAGAVAGAVAGGGGSPRAPWWLFALAAFAAACLSSIAVGRHEMRAIAAFVRRLGVRATVGRMVRMARPGLWFPIVVNLVLVLVGVAAASVTLTTALSSPAERRPVIAAAALFGAVLGLGVPRWICLLQEFLRSRYRRPFRPRPLDGVLVQLTCAAAVCHWLRPSWWTPRTVRSVRLRLGFAVAAANDTWAVRHRTSFTELAARREARRFHAALAELVRRHDRALTQVRTAQEYDAIAASLRAGVVALAEGDLTSLLEHSAPEPPVSRAVRLLRRIGPSLVLVAFALAIPLLPGVDGGTGAGVRVLLLMTAALSLTPAGDAASTSVRSALERSLFTGRGQ